MIRCFRRLVFHESDIELPLCVGLVCIYIGENNFGSFWSSNMFAVIGHVWFAVMSSAPGQDSMNRACHTNHVKVGFHQVDHHSEYQCNYHYDYHYAYLWDSHNHYHYKSQCDYQHEYTRVLHL